MRGPALLLLVPPARIRCVCGGGVAVAFPCANASLSLDSCDASRHDASAGAPAPASRGCSSHAALEALQRSYRNRVCVLCSEVRPVSRPQAPSGHGRARGESPLVVSRCRARRRGGDAEPGLGGAPVSLRQGSFASPGAGRGDCACAPVAARTRGAFAARDSVDHVLPAGPVPALRRADVRRRAPVDRVCNAPREGCRH